MVSGEALFGGLVAALLLVTLAITLPVVVRIFRDGRDRWRERRLDAVDPPDAADDSAADEPADEPSQLVAEEREAPSDRPSRTEDGRVRCPHCGAVTDPAYRYCRACVEPV